MTRADSPFNGPGMGCDAPYSALYVGDVMHRRMGRVVHRFRYRVFSFLLDLGRLDDLADRMRLFSVDRFNLFSFHHRDHGDRDGGDVDDWARKAFRDAGLAPDRVMLLCFPRIFGFVFNPLSVFYGYDADGVLIGVIHEVSNTFGERHCYVFATKAEVGSSPIRLDADKAFHVSPFLEIDGHYHFRMLAPGDTLVTAIDYRGAADRLVAVQTGRRETLDDANLLKRMVTHPLMTIKIILAIHWEALGLWRRGAVFHKKPPPPVPGLSFAPAPAASETGEGRQDGA